MTTPLTKAIATLEGWLLAGAAVVPWVVSLIDPHTLPAHLAAEWSTISAIALGVSRTIIKGVAVAKTTTGVAPIPVDVEALAKNITAHIGVALPSTDALKQVVAEGVQLAQQSLPTDLQELEAQPLPIVAPEPVPVPAPVAPVA